MAYCADGPRLYNALRQCGFMPAVPLLGELCMLLRQNVFLGNLPDRSFVSGCSHAIFCSATLTRNSQNLPWNCIMSSLKPGLQ
ncbi:hypothetical protein Ct61P_02091 [Colletotrichum tofieldiae]|nr:hypothetical protein Ct61P_02091 [Colletotrichum tofieldiae]